VAHGRGPRVPPPAVPRRRRGRQGAGPEPRRRRPAGALRLRRAAGLGERPQERLEQDRAPDLGPGHAAGERPRALRGLDGARLPGPRPSSCG
jgi:hypothetical protein